MRPRSPQHLRRIGLDVEIQEVAPGRPNVIGVLEGRGKGRSLMFCGHVDTVGVEGMAAPFDPVERGGRLYGRGSQDMKGGVAAMIDAARIIADEGLAGGAPDRRRCRRRGVRELGADALVTRWRADGAVVTEPTDLRIAVGHKGFAWFGIETRGRAAHGSRPRDGRDAILRMGRVLHALEALDRRLQAVPPHPLMGTASLHASIIAGGRELSSYPDSCSLKLERRTITGETDAQVLARDRGDPRQAEKERSRVRGVRDAAVRASLVRGRPPPTPCRRRCSDVRPCVPARPSIELFARQVTTARPDKDQDFVGMSFWTDAAVLGGAGIPSVLFGPGGAGLHSLEEYVDVDDVLRCRDTLAALARRWCVHRTLSPYAVLRNTRRCGVSR